MGTLITGQQIIPYVLAAKDLYTKVSIITKRYTTLVEKEYYKNLNTAADGGSVQNETSAAIETNFATSANLYQVVRGKATDGNEHYTQALDDEISQLKTCLSTVSFMFDLWLVGAVKTPAPPPGPPPLPITIIGDPSVVPQQLPNGWVVYEFKTPGLGNIIIENSDGGNPLKTYLAQVYIVGGGGGGGGGQDAQFGIGGGGGASVPEVLNFTLTQSQLVLTVGAGGPGQADGDATGFAGQESTFSTVVPAVPQSTLKSAGGRYGGVGDGAGQSIDVGMLSCGGGGGGNNGAGGTGTFAGGSGFYNEQGGSYSGGGGGGSRSAGVSAAGNNGGDGGTGRKTVLLSGLAYFTGSGGGGGIANAEGAAPGAGGAFFDTLGGSTPNTNSGGNPDQDGNVGLPNTGSGGGGAGIAGNNIPDGGDGSDGIVVFAFKYF